MIVARWFILDLLRDDKDRKWIGMDGLISMSRCWIITVSCFVLSTRKHGMIGLDSDYDPGRNSFQWYRLSACRFSSEWCLSFGPLWLIVKVFTSRFHFHISVWAPLILHRNHARCVQTTDVYSNHFVFTMFSCTHSPYITPHPRPVGGILCSQTVKALERNGTTSLWMPSESVKLEERRIW